MNIHVMLEFFMFKNLKDVISPVNPTSFANSDKNLSWIETTSGFVIKIQF